MPSRSERGIAPSPKEIIAPETKLVQDLTVDDLKRIAAITKGRFIDTNAVYSFEVGEVMLGTKNMICLVLRDDNGRKSVSFRGINGEMERMGFRDIDTVTLAKNSVTVKDHSRSVVISPKEFRAKISLS